MRSKCDGGRQEMAEGGPSVTYMSRKRNIMLVPLSAHHFVVDNLRATAFAGHSIFRTVLNLRL